MRCNLKTEQPFYVWPDSDPPIYVPRVTQITSLAPKPQLIEWMRREMARVVLSQVALNESLRDLIGGTLDTYLSVVSNRINQVMKILTIFTALFMPISFLAGFFGMNFTRVPFDNSPLLIGTLIVMVVTPVLMFLWFRHRGWI